MSPALLAPAAWHPQPPSKAEGCPIPQGMCVQPRNTGDSQPSCAMPVPTPTWVSVSPGHEPCTPSLTPHPCATPGHLGQDAAPVLHLAVCQGAMAAGALGGVSDGPCWSHYISFSLALSVDMRDQCGFSGRNHCAAALPDGWQGQEGAAAWQQGEDGGEARGHGHRDTPVWVITQPGHTGGVQAPISLQVLSKARLWPTRCPVRLRTCCHTSSWSRRTSTL